MNKLSVGVIVGLLVFAVQIVLADHESPQQYQAARSELIAQQQALNMSSRSVFAEQLSADERLVGDYFRSLLEQEIRGHWERGYFPPSHNFLHSRVAIDASNSSLLPFLRSLPKGGNLHTHLTSAASFHWLVYNASYRSDAYLFVPDDYAASLTVAPGRLFAASASSKSKSPIHAVRLSGGEQRHNVDATYTPRPATLAFYPAPPSDSRWTPVAAIRARLADPAAFDQLLLGSFTMEGRDDGSYAELWDHFDAIFERVDVSYEPVFRQFLLNVFAQTIADGLQHLETRSGLMLLYNESGALQPAQRTFEVIEAVVEQARQLYDADFTFALIWSHGRHSARSVIMKDMEKCLFYKALFPALIVGYDLVGAEDEGHSLDYFADEFLAIVEQARALRTTFRFFFHAGESVLASNQNLFDALLLNASRVGHGFALARQPMLIERYKAGQLSLEVCPISNQVLRYVHDLQNHPGLVFFRKNVPFSIASDDPGVFGYSGTSYDWWMASVAWQLDLVGLKQLALNSLAFARFPTEQARQHAVDVWLARWQAWIAVWKTQALAQRH